MKVKIDTKEKFHVITVNETTLSADMTGNLHDTLIPYLQNVVPNIILDLCDVEYTDNLFAEKLVKIQQKFYEAGHSFVISGLQPGVENYLDDSGLLEIINHTPTSSEAGDIILMEEIERELMEGDDLLND